MKTLYAACLRNLGLSQEDAALVHAKYGKEVRRDTINSWSSGRREAPLGAYRDLQAFAAEMRTSLPPSSSVDEALFLADQVTISSGDQLGLANSDPLIAALAARLLSEPAEAA